MFSALGKHLEPGGRKSAIGRARSKVLALTLAVTLPALTALAMPAARFNIEPHGAPLRVADQSGNAEQSAPPAEAGAIPHVPETAPQPAAPEAAKAEGEKPENGEKAYVSRIVKEGNAITLRGQVPSDDDRKTIQGVIAATFPGANIVDKAKVNPAVPGRDAWLAGMNFALRQLAKLEEGTAILRDDTVSFEGAAKTEQDFKLMQQKLREEVPNGVQLGNVELKPPSVSPFVWLAQMQPGSVSLSGHVPLELDQDLFTYAKSIFGSFHVSNSMALALGAPENWLDAAKLSLSILSLLQHGTVIVTDKVITVDGVLSAGHSREHVKALGAQVPEGFKLETSVIEAESYPRSGAAAEVSVAAKRTEKLVSP